MEGEFSMLSLEDLRVYLADRGDRLATYAMQRLGVERY